jgi:hypothetical protein
MFRLIIFLITITITNSLRRHNNEPSLRLVPDYTEVYYYNVIEKKMTESLSISNCSISYKYIFITIYHYINISIYLLLYILCSLINFSIFRNKHNADIHARVVVPSGILSNLYLISI